MTPPPQVETPWIGKRLVVKIGSALLVDSERGTIKRTWLNAFVDDVAQLRDRGFEVVLVSSGAIAAGRRHLGLPRRALRLEEKQAAAAVGQVNLAHAYQEALARHNTTAAQVLLTLGDTEGRRRYLNARSTLETLLRLGAVPVINENDTVATEEIRFGDNDRLAARVAAMIGADVLVLLSDIDGLYTADPRNDPTAEHLPLIEQLTPEQHAMAGDPNPAFGTGGMVTKLLAAEIAMGAGCRMVIALGHPLNPLRAIEQGARATVFSPSSTPLAARKQWIAASLRSAGVLVVDEGAAAALRKQKSLLPAGVVEVRGDFQRGDAVTVQDAAGLEIARGLVAYGADDARRIRGHQSASFERLLGYQGREELIHRDDLVLHPRTPIGG